MTGVSEQYPHQTNERQIPVQALSKELIHRSEMWYVGKDKEDNDLILTHIKDITESFELEKNLVENRQRLQSMSDELNAVHIFFYASPVAMGTAELTEGEDDIKFHMVNPKFAQLLGKNADELVGKTATGIGYSTELAKGWASYYVKAKQLKSYQVFEHTNPVTKGIASVVVAHIRDNLFSFLAQDISYRRELENKLKEQAEKLEETVKERTKELETALQVKSRFLAIMSHEMRTPLCGILGSMSLLEQSNLTTEQQELLRMVQVCGEQLSMVIDDILDLTKLEENKVQLESEPFNLKDTLEESAEVVASAAEKKELEIICNLQCSCATVMGDARSLRQIVVNLLSNSVKFSNKGEIVLTATATPVSALAEPENCSAAAGACEVTISVQDNGIGIPKAAQSQLFQPFTQADTSMTRRYGGSGLGLSISKRLAELMGGKIWFESEEGHGSTFHFTVRLLCCCPQQQPAMTPLPQHLQQQCVQLQQQLTAQPQQQFSKQTVLIVDKSETHRNVLAQQMTAWNLNALTFSTISEVLESFNSRNSNSGNNNDNNMDLDESNSNNSDRSNRQLLLWSDIQLALIDSKQDLTAMHQNFPKNFPTVIMCPSLKLSELQQQFSLIIKKPIRAKTLLTLLQQTLLLQQPQQGDVVGNRNNNNTDNAIRLLIQPSQATTPISTTTAIAMQEPKSDKYSPTSSSSSSSPCFMSTKSDSQQTAPLPVSVLSRRLLVAEDNAVNQKVIKRLLESMGFTNVAVVENGVAALQTVKTQQIDLILMDCMMPEMGGIECTERIRAELPQDNQPIVIALTADVFLENRAKCLKAGMNDVLTKPVQRTKLLQELQHYLGK